MLEYNIHICTFKINYRDIPLSSSPHRQLFCCPPPFPFPQSLSYQENLSVPHFRTLMCSSSNGHTAVTIYHICLYCLQCVYLYWLKGESYEIWDFTPQVFFGHLFVSPCMHAFTHFLERWKLCWDFRLFICHCSGVFTEKKNFWLSGEDRILSTSNFNCNLCFFYT
jgi:hypothetical protein